MEIKEIEQEIIDHPKLDILGLGIIFLAMALAIIYFFRSPIPKPLPASVTLAVPFSSQAPTGNWERNEDCEETSITMANAFLTGSTEDKLPAGAAQNAINNLKKWEQTNLGYNKNTGVDATRQMAIGAFNLKITPIQNFTKTDLKTALANNQPILLPINAKLLPGTHYINGGPLYHMIVIRGYHDDTFIVNDPGTENGDGNEYSFDILQKAAADWNNVTQKIDVSRKFVLIISK